LSSSGRGSRRTRFQEGEEPAEDAAALPAETGTVLNELEDLILRINRTNAATHIGPDGTITDVVARRDVLRARHSVVTAAADGRRPEPGHGTVLPPSLFLTSSG
jgi:hypothetical protein